MIGERLAKVRGSRSRDEFSTHLGVHLNTYSRYERGERELGAQLLAQLALEGWNMNWLLTGKGPERLDQVAAPPSQSGRSENIALAVQLLREAEEAAGGALQWAPEQQGEATVILVRLLEMGMATAEVRSIAKQQIRLFSADKA